MYIEFEEGEKYAKSQNNDKSDDLSTFKDAGYLLEPDDLIIDIDTISKEAVNSLITMFGIKTKYVITERGVHFYYKKPSGFRWANVISPLGIPIEYKHQSNTLAITVKRHGVAREVFNEGVREELPNIFKYKRGFKDLQGLSDSEGRNNALYAHKMQLGNMRGWQNILKFINWHVFDTPLPANEFEVLARTEVIPTGEKNGEVEVAKYLVQKHDYIQYAGEYYYRPTEDEVHVIDKDDRYMIRQIIEVAGDVKIAYQDEVLKQMKRRAKHISADKVFKIRLNNGYLYEGKFYPVTYKGFTPYSIDIDYVEDIEPVKVVDDYLDHLTKNDPDYRQLLEEVLGHTLIVEPEFKRLLSKFFIFIGDGGNGKGTLLQIIKAILNKENCTAMDISELADERYLVTFKGKLANLGDDIQDGVINDKYMKVIKNITSCDTMSTRELYKQAMVMSFTGTLIFTSNHVIKSFEKGKSFKRRVMWLPMYTQVEEGKKDPKFISKLTSLESKRYWIKLMIDGYKRLYENTVFTHSELTEQFNADYHQENNPYLLYLSDMNRDKLIDKPVNEIYKDCADWCFDNGIDNFSKAALRSTIREVFKLETNGQRKINGKNWKVFKEIS